MIPHRTIEANEFVLRDSEGKKRAVLGLEDGQPNLVLFDASGNAKVLLASTEDGPGLVFYADGDSSSCLRGMGNALLSWVALISCPFSLRYPFNTPIGTRRAALRARPAWWTTSTTSSTSL